jgi:photosystem II stability/assembly factor-like uncharacterized protein
MRVSTHGIGRKLPAVLLFLSGIGLGALVVLHPTAENEERDLQRLRQEWFYRQRAFPHTHVPARAREFALQQLKQKLRLEQSARAANPNAIAVANPVWHFVGPRPIQTPYSAPIVSGRVSALAVDPNNVSVVYLGAAQGGVWKTTNGGSSWMPLTDNAESTAIGSIAIDPSNSNVIYVGTGEENFSGDSYYGAGILKSTDAGGSWTQICGPFCGPTASDAYYGGGAHIGALAVSPSNSQVLLAAAAVLFHDGIYRSTDGGSSWNQVVTDNPGNSVVFDPTDGDIAYASIGNVFAGGAESVLKSTDGGATWDDANGSGGNALDLSRAGRIVLALARSSGSTLYASVAEVSTGNLSGFYKTTDGGDNWTRLSATPDYCTPQCGYDNVVAVQPTNPNVIYAGGAFVTTLVRSTDGGASWSLLQSAQNSGFLHADMHALEFSSDGNTLYLGNDGGAYVATQVTDPTPSFTALNNTLGITQYYPGIASHPTSAAPMLGGTQDNGTVLYSGIPTWQNVTCGDGGYTVIDPRNPSTMYTGCQLINLLKSTSSGTFGTWNQVINGINTTDRVDFIPPFVMDPSNSQKLYFGSYRIYQTNDGAASWTAISPDLTSGDSFFGVISAIAVAPSNSSTVYVGTMDGLVQVTTNANAGPAATWTNVSAGLGTRGVTSVAVDPATSMTAYAALSGFAGFDNMVGHVFKTTNGGSSWLDISGDLPNTPVNFLATAPDAPNTLFVATDIGVFYTTNGGAQWQSLVNSLPQVAVLGLSLQASSRSLRAATHGRGMWEVDVSSIAPLALRVISVTHPSSNTIHLQCHGVANAVNRIESSSSPSAQTFGPLASAMANTNGDFVYDDTNAGVKKFYRIAYP